jgi:NNP family nitrate/nitrite transporter-like MFS transporter
MNRKLQYLVVGYALTVAFGLSLQFLPPVIPVMKATLSMTAGQAGMLMSSLALFGIVVSPLVGYLADRWGGRTVGLLGLACLIAAEAWFALSTSYTNLLMARLAMGIGSATLSILGAQIISQNFAGTRYLGAAMGTMNTAVPTSILISQLGFARLAAARGWQAPVWVSLAFTCVVTVAYILFYHDPESTQDKALASLFAGLQHLDPQVWVLGLVWLFWNAGALVLLTFANDFLVGRGMSPQSAGTMASILMVFPMAASAVMGHILDHRRWQGRGAVLACLMFAGCVVLLGVFSGGVLPLFLGVSFTFALAPAAVFGLAPYLLHDRESGLGYGILAGMLNVGVLFGPAIGGIVRDATGSYLASFIMAGVLTSVGAVCVLLLRRPAIENA